MCTEKKRTGFETPLIDIKDDFFSRARFASHIFEHMSNIPQEWSVRIAINGKWGEGKTSVLNFIEGMANKNEDIVIKFNPWTISSTNEMWLNFIFKLTVKLEKAEIMLPITSKAGALLDKVTKFRGLAKANKIADSVADTGLGLIANYLKPKGETFKKILSQLGKRRIIVIIDDLDRTDPKLIPNLLMSLREVLDLPGFSFILSFDTEIVNEALQKYHPAWGKGDDFLEKILDFRYTLPTPTQSQIEKLFKSEVENYCSFIENDIVEEVSSLLPRNPRKLKSLVRELQVLGKQIKRHDEEEIDCFSIMIGIIMKLEAPKFLEEYLDEYVDNGESIHKKHTLPYNNNEADKKKLEKWESLLKKLDINDKHTKSKLELLVRTWQEKNHPMYTSGIRYQVGLGAYPPTITLKECKEFLAKWKVKKSILTINKLVVSQSKEMMESPEVVAFDFFNRLIEYRDSLLSLASDVNTTNDNKNYLKEASVCLDLLSELFRKSLKCLDDHFFISVENFKAFLSQCDRWVHSNRNESDRLERAKEKAAILIFKGFELKKPEQYLRLIYDINLQDLNRLERKELKESLISEFKPLIPERIISIMGTQNGVKTFWNHDTSSVFHDTLFNKESLLWKEPLKSKFITLIEQANENAVIHENCLELLKITTYLVTEGATSELQAQIKEMITSTELIQKIWNAIVSTEIQFRGRKDLDANRQSLIGLGVSEEFMPKPDWLENLPS